MKRKKAPLNRASAGTVLAARARAEGNQWTDAEREKLGEEFMRLYNCSPGSSSGVQRTGSPN
jgi:hypothetical protein